jgi:hypothetical protein
MRCEKKLPFFDTGFALAHDQGAAHSVCGGTAHIGLLFALGWNLLVGCWNLPYSIAAVMRQLPV